MIQGHSRPGTGRVLDHVRVAVMLVLLCAISWVHQAHYDFQHDDAYISYRYAKNWAEGAGPVFNVGERVEGYSNFLLVALLALIRRLGGDVIVLSRSFGTLSCWALLATMFWMMRSRFRRSAPLALAGSAALALHAALATWARSGLETLPLAFLVLLAHLVFLREHDDATPHWRSGLLFGIVALLRADGFLFLAGASLFLLLRRQKLGRLASLILPFAGVFLPYFVWRWSYYGWLLPNSYYVKTGGDLYQQLRGFFYAYEFIVPFGGIFLFASPLLLIVLRDPARDAARLYLGISTLLFSIYIVLVGGDHMPMSRFFVPLVAPLVLLTLEAAVEIQGRLADSLPPGPGPRRALAVVLFAPIVLSGLLPTLNKRRIPHTHAMSVRLDVARWTTAGKWFGEHIPPDKVLASLPVGALAFFSNLKTIDMLGINDVHIAHLKVPGMGHGSAGHEKKDFDYILSHKPDLIFWGVVEDDEHAGERITYPDGSTYTMRCASLGRGFDISQFGETKEVDWFLCYREREPTAAEGGSESRTGPGR